MKKGSIQDLFNDVADRPVLTVARAVSLFDWLADMEDIAFGFHNEGCYARAHIMCCRLFEKNYAPEKAWAFEGERRLKVILPEGGKGDWCYHVAPALDVRWEDGRVEKMVFDPGLFNGPVSLADWGKVMMAAEDRLSVVPFGVAPLSYKGDYTPLRPTSDACDQDAESVMRKALRHQRKPVRTVYSSDVRDIVVKENPALDLTSGKTWDSISLYFRKQRIAAQETSWDQDELSLDPPAPGCR
jgi:hypothetical protein